MKKSLFALAFALGATAALPIHAAGDGALPSAAELDAMALQITQTSFHDKGIIKTAEVIKTITDDPALKACAQAGITGHALSADEAKKLEALNMKTIQWPSDGNYLGDWHEGDKIAESGRGRTWKDKPGAPNGGNCYNCHQVTKEQISFGTIGPSLYHYGKIRGVTDPADPKSAEIVKYTWGKIWNAKAYNACSNMPRMGSSGTLTEGQVRDLMALLLDPESPVNKD